MCIIQVVGFKGDPWLSNSKGLPYLSLSFSLIQKVTSQVKLKRKLYICLWILNKHEFSQFKSWSQRSPAGWRLSMIHICLQRLRTSTTSSPWPHLSSFILKPKDCVNLSKYINTLKQPVSHFILYHLHLIWGKQLE